LAGSSFSLTAGKYKYYRGRSGVSFHKSACLPLDTPYTALPPVASRMILKTNILNIAYNGQVVTRIFLCANDLD
jgi:hypothetical protein